MSLKKFTAFVLITALALPVLPAKKASASSQPVVTGLSIGYTPTSGGLYDILLRWTEPGPQDPTNTADSFPGNNNANYFTHGAAQYGIEYKDVTRANASAWLSVSDPPDPAQASSYTFKGFSAAKGILYSFRPVPYHYHATQNPSGVYVTQAVRPAETQMREVMFMGDIEVESSGKSGELTVEWDNPIYGSSQVFPYFNIYYAKGENPKTKNPVNVYYNDCVKIPSAGTETGKGPRLSYTIKNSSITPGVYRVVVEPCVSQTQELRKMSSPAPVTVPGKSYPIPLAFTNNDYEKPNATVAISVWLVEQGRDIVYLTWGNIRDLGDIKEIAVFSSNTESGLGTLLDEYVKIKEGDPGANPVTPLLTLTSPYATQYQLPNLDITTFYGIVVTVDAGGGQNAAIRSVDPVAYRPGAVVITPNTPYIHEIDSDKDFANNALTLYWDVFQRQSYFTGDTVSEIIIDSKPYSYDNDVSYDLYISDDLNTISGDPAALELSGIKPVATLTGADLGAAGEHAGTIGGPLLPSYNWSVSNYTDKDGVRKVFQKNKLYYIMLVAKKPTLDSSGQENPNRSVPAYSSFYISMDGDISSPSMMRKPPLEVRKDSLGSDVVTETEIDVTWIEKWTEVYDYSRSLTAPYVPANATAWQVLAAVTGADISYGDDTKGKEKDLVPFHTKSEAAARSALGISADVPVRSNDISGSGYEVKVMPYGAFTSAVDSAAPIGTESKLDAYLRGIMENEPYGSSGWVTYTAQGGTLQSETKTVDGSVAEYKYVNVPGLTANTTYAILVRPFRTVNGSPLLGYANFISATTAPSPTPLDVEPTTPIVEAVTYTDTSATIRWNNTASIRYEVVYSDIYYPDIENQAGAGIHIDYDEVMKNSRTQMEGTVEYRYLDINGLFPDTEYYFWVKARSGSGRTSYWSNPAWVKTIPLKTPDSPAGLGIVSENELKLINDANGTDFTPKAKDYLIMEWLKDINDPVTTGTGTGTSVAEILTEPTLTDAYVAKFNGLLTNKTYYFRAKTIVTATMTPDKKTQLEYSYLVQICLEPDFIEMTQIYVPSEPALTMPYRQAESDWTRTIYYRTDTSSDDFDSDFDPDLVPLPDEDFEITYNGATQTLTYRFRSAGKDAKGNYDNRVDQRFISKLVNRQTHNYNIDVTKYEDYVIKNRVVEVPYTLLKTFEERKITFGIRAGDVTVELPPKTMETPLVKNVPDYGDNAKLQVVFTENPGNKPSLGAKDSYAMTPQDVSLYIQTPTQYQKMPYAGAPLGVRLKLDSRYDVMDQSLGAYVSTEQTEGWSRVNSRYDKENGRLEFSSGPGMYAIISKGAPDTVAFDQSTTSMLNVASSLAVTDMPVYNGNQTASSNQMLNLIDAMINGKSEVALNRVPGAEAVSAIQKSGINIGPDAPSVSREQAIAAMVRLYEIKAKKQIKSTYNLANTPYRDTSAAHEAYQPALLKAAEIDMLNGGSVRPKESLTLGELFELADVVISDLGY